MKIRIDYNISSVWDYTILSVLRGQISNNSNYRKKFEYLVKFILMKILINFHNMEVCAQPIQNL
jgi:hypothetical protein